MSATINNNTVSFNAQETLPLLLRLVDPEELAKYDCMTPTALGYLADYDDGLQQMDWQIDVPIGGYPKKNPSIYAQGNDDMDCDAGAANPGTRPTAYHSFCKQRPSIRHEPPRGNGLLPQTARLVEDQTDIVTRRCWQPSCPRDC